MIATQGLSRSFDGRTAVQDLSFQVPEGRLCALLGPNGAGKTTTVRMLLGLLPPTAGTAEVAGIALPASRARTTTLRARAGLLTETPGFYDRLSGAENLDFFGRLYGIPDAERTSRVNRWLTRLDLTEARDRPFGTYSKGMKQRIALIRAVFHEPRVIFLDEPTAGLDPAAAREVRELIAALRSEGRTILLCTHHLGEAEELADLIGILQQRLLRFGSKDELLGAGSGVAIRLTQDGAGFVTAVRGIAGVSDARPDGHLDGHLLQVDTDVTRIPEVVAALTRAGAGIMEVRPVRASLEEVYLQAVGGKS
jgi:ABC-2 type transport system ATP-binding protein